MESERLSWIKDNKIFEDEDIGEYYGFIYLITNTVTNRKYIGKKFFYSSKTKQVKGKKKKSLVSSNWKLYYGSNDELSKDIEALGKEYFTREITHLCKSKGECGYLEAKEQFVQGALESNDYYNTWIMVRVRKSHIKGLLL